MRDALVSLVSLLTLCVFTSRVAVAQEGAAAARWAVGAGASVMEFDANAEAPGRGMVLRAGVAANWIADVAVVGQYWPDLGYWSGRSLVLEATTYPAGRPRISPFILFGIGYFRASERAARVRPGFDGIAKTFGVGVTGRVWGSLGVRLDGSVRFDPGSFDDELRLMLTSSPALFRPPGLPSGTSQGAVYSLTPVTGPWHVVEPGVGLAFTTPVTPRADATVDVLLLHWHTEETAGFTGWDTRAVLALPAVALVSGEGRARFRLGGGPAGTLMFEGPDDGLRGGVHADAGFTWALGGGFVGSATATVLWLVRSERPDLVSSSQLSATDERAVLLRVGVGR